MTLPLSWKLAGAAIGLVAAVAAWNGISRYLAARHANEIIQEASRAAAMEAQRAQAQARRHHDERAADLRQQREALASNYRQVTDQAREYQARRAVQLGKQLEEAQRIEASYLLDENQHCANGIVINRRGSTFTQARGQDGRAIQCRGDRAAEPLR